MRRRDFLINSMAGVAGSAFPLIARGQSKPCPPPSVASSGGTSAATACGGSAEADWVSRSTGAGVLWAHDFREDWEVDQFRTRNGMDPDALQGPTAAYFGTAASYVVSVPSTACYRDTRNGIGGGSCVSVDVHPFYTTLAQPLLLPGDAGYSASVSLAEALPAPKSGWNKFDAPWSTRLMLMSPDGSSFEMIELTSQIAGDSQFGIERGAESKFGSVVQRWPAGSKVIIPGHAGPDWTRPFSPLSYADSSIPNDRGYVASDPRGPKYDAYRESGSSALGWNWGYLRNPKDRTGQLVGGYNTDLRADEIYLQMRVKWVNRVKPRPFTPPGGKFLFIDRRPDVVSAQEIIVQSTQRGVPSLYQSGGSAPAMGDPQGQASDYSPARGTNSNRSEQPGGQWAATCLQKTDPEGCFVFPDDEWVTLLIRIKPGMAPRSHTITTLAEEITSVPSSGTEEILKVANASAFPQFVPGVRESFYYIKVGATGGPFEPMKVVGVNVSNNTIAVQRGKNHSGNSNTLAFPAGTQVRMDPVQQMYARWEPYPWHSILELKIAYPGESNYRTVFSMDDIMLFMDDPDLANFGWSRMTLSAYHNGYPSFVPWSHKLAQVICSTQYIPPPRV